MPDDLHLHLRTGSQRAVLRLRRSQHIDVGRVPVYTVGDDQRVVRAQLPEATEAAVYGDIHHGAALLVKRPHGVGTEFHLHGTLHMGDRQFTISPSPSSQAGSGARSGMQHILRAIQNDASYGHDYLDPGPNAEEETGGRLSFSETTGRETTGPKTRGKRQTTGPKTTGPRTSGPKTTGPKTTGPKATGLKTRGKRQTTQTTGRAEQRTPTQQTASRHNIDINIVCDFACFNRFYKRQGKNETRALEEARLYFSYLCQSVDVRFRTISDVRPDVVISVTPISIITSKTAKGSVYSEASRVAGSSDGVDGNRLLKAFRTWVTATRLPTAPTTVLQTGYSLSRRRVHQERGSDGDDDDDGDGDDDDNDDDDDAGIAYRGGACTKSGVVVVEEKFHGITGMITAHEMGHSVNSKHDGAYSSEGARCTGDGARHVMSTYVGVPQGSSKPWTFSPCSARAIADFVSARSRRGGCFPDSYERLVAANAGQTYRADDQCALALGSGSFFCRGHQYQTSVGFEGMCTKMYCSVSPTHGHTCTAIVPFQYTSCGDRKWCIDGQCVYDEKAPPKIKDSCAQGDDPSYGCSQQSCGRLSLPRDVFCCHTCHAPPPSPRTPSARRPTSTPRLTSATAGEGSPTARRAVDSIGWRSARASSAVDASVRTNSSAGASASSSSSAHPDTTTASARPTTTATRSTTIFTTTKTNTETKTETTTTTSAVKSTASITTLSPSLVPETTISSPATSTTTSATTTQPTTPTSEATTASPSGASTTEDIFLPSICRVSRYWCQFCIRSNHRYRFCRH
ncbi:hypothetical protein ACOMHN_042855 [Nucella lapillus]